MASDACTAAFACDTSACLGKTVREVTVASHRFQDVLRELAEAACEGIDEVEFQQPVSASIEGELRARGFETTRRSGKLVVSYTPEAWVQNENFHNRLAAPYQGLQFATPV
jgi:hypothetical protein